jgi:peptidoglycan/xylan/chitin deacetylase (PgdA/CDA1 family)
LKKHRVKGSFFFTGRFYRNPSFKKIIQQLKQDGHYLGAHSDEHLLYCDWVKRDSLLVTQQQFNTDLLNNYAEMKKFSIDRKDALFFLPPYEWYNDSIASWTAQLGLQLINYTPGTLSHADYTTPDMKNYRSSGIILKSVYEYESSHASGLNGFILLMHIGAGQKRTDKFYNRLNELLAWLKQKKYQVVPVDKLLQDQ